MNDLTARLEALATEETATRTMKQVRCLRGVRGVAAGDLARLAAAAWAEQPPRLPQDREALDKLFGGAWEDGLVAIGLLAAALGDDPKAALELATDWAERTDDTATADALGWLVLAPAVLVLDVQDRVVGRLLAHARPETRRAAVAMGLGFTPAPIEGPAAAPLRERVGERHARIVDAPLDDRLARLLDRSWRDPSPVVQKVVRRVLREWSTEAPEAALAWADGIRGGIPKVMRAEIRRPRGDA